MATLNVTLPAEMIDFVDGEVSAGDYASSDDVVREALRLLKHDREREAETAALLQREIGTGLKEAREKRFSTLSVEEIADEVLRNFSTRQ